MQELKGAKDVYSSLELLKLTGIGPAQQIECEFAPRLNLVTGDNGLGKTFLLECGWWALTGFWPGYEARPRPEAAKEVPKIAFQIGRNGQSDRVQTVKYQWDQLKWNTSTRR